MRDPSKSTLSHHSLHGCEGRTYIGSNGITVDILDSKRFDLGIFAVGSDEDRTWSVGRVEQVLYGEVSFVLEKGSWRSMISCDMADRRRVDGRKEG